MSENNFLSKIIQIIGFFFTVGAVILQFFYRSEFREVFGITNKVYFEAFSTAGLILGLLALVILYSFRYSLTLRFHPRTDKYKAYLNYINDQQKPEDQRKNLILETEPFYIDGKRLGIICFILSPVFFFLIFYTSEPVIKSLFYLLFLLFVVFSAFIFLMTIYLEEDYKKKIEVNRMLLERKINESLAPKYTVLREYYNDINIFYPVIEMTIKVEGKGEFIVVAHANSADRLFNIYPAPTS